MPALNGSAGSSAAARRLTDITGLWCAAAYCALAFFARQPGEPALSLFFLTAACAGLPVFFLYFYISRRGERFPVGRIFLWAAVFRFCGLLGGPFFEDDFYRYLWDGYRFATAGTPYGLAPEAFFADPAVPKLFQGILDQINNPGLATIYAPVTQFVFLLGYYLSPGSVTALQAILIVFDLATIALLFRLTSAGNVMLYAWCPLVVKEIAFTAHPDGVGVCFLLAAIVLSRKSRWKTASICLGMAAATKVFALLLVPLLLLRAAPRYWMLSAAVFLGLYAPFVLSGGTDMQSFAVFAREWEFNSALFGLLSAVLGTVESKLVLGLGFAALWISYGIHYRKSGERIPRGDLLYGALLAVSTVINPWYLLWLLPFAAVFPTAWAWTASLAVLASYITGLNLNDYTMGPYQQPVWVRPLEFTPIVLAAGYDMFRYRRQKTGR
ncbi:MAG: hypothetical protein F4Y78_02280 [Candidatus Dadabacteria bacterium]|nr:hypothetical protein [Candidatus Dadabacteria bacterium]MYA47712.1 hypothetical protein [Candidatus Dadabacteria bacterium]MYF48121.1 hypothetical protein [Candidatus Dadabacteria bacterium]MYG82746.1 hypothetical protein [Candidatus Dadabacteria bacterium]MYK50120.1 hypothetical protein [Candidatus Dadabacteria bacterium]